MSRERAAFAAGLCLLVAAAFSGVVRGEFLAFDDDVYVTGNPLVTGGVTWPAMLAAFTTFYAGNWHPLTWLSHMLDVSLFGLTPAGPHAVNAGIHALNAVLAYLALAELTGTRWRAALAAALFAVHPLRVESVAWIAERKDVLSACFGLASLWAWARFAHTGSRASYWGSVGLFAAGLMAKPMLVTLPFLFVLLEWWPLGRKGARPAPFQGARPAPFIRTLLEKWPFLLLVLGSCLVTLAAQSPGVKLVPLELRLENAGVAYAEYLRRVVAPRELAALYPYPVSISFRALLVSGIAVGGVTAFALAQARRRPWLAVGWLWFAGMLVPTLGLVQVGVQAFADRYTYLPFLGIALAVSYSLAELAARVRFGREIAAGIAALVLALLVWQTRIQVETWRDSVSVFTRAIDVTRSNWFAHTELGVVLMTRGELQPARDELEAALRIRADNPRALANLGLVEIQLGAPAKGAPLLERALGLDPELAGGRLALGIAYERVGGRIAEAEDAYRAALADPRGSRDAKLRLARLLSMSGNPALRDGAQAVALCEAACRESPCDSPEELDVCALAAMEAGDTANAIAKGRQALELARGRGDSALAAKLEAHLASYSRGEPVRMPSAAPR